jgi:prepilin-type N-terminal cleavage/methylation domain-containing protein
MSTGAVRLIKGLAVLKQSLIIGSAFLIMTMKRARNRNRKGFSLAEAMVATVVLGIAAAGVLLPFTTGAKVRAEGTRRTLAAKLASDLMEEIVNTPFDQVVGQYNGHTEIQGEVKDANGVVFSDLNYANFSRDASCAYVYVEPQSAPFAAPNFIWATVRVYYSGGEMVVINRLISEH